MSKAKKTGKKVLSKANEADAFLDKGLNKIPFVGKHIAALTSGAVLLVIVGIIVVALVW